MRAVNSTFTRLGALTGIGRLALLALLLVPSLGPDCNPSALLGEEPVQATAPGDVRSIENLVGCLNDKLAQAQGDVSIADTVQCIPPCCTLTLTMSRASAQAGCFMGGSGDPNPPGLADPAPTTADTQGPGPRCQLPRIILDCPGPPQLMPSYSLCPVGSVSEDVQGSNRIEVGEVIDCDGNMRMGDIPLPPGPFDPQDPIHDFISQVDGGQGTKNCNLCHGNPQVDPPMGADEISDPFPFNPDCIICTDDPDRTAVSANCQQKVVDNIPVPPARTTTQQCLSDICGCIGTAVDTVGHPLNNDQGDNLLRLCEALESYQTDRGVCGDEACPEPSGPTCIPPQIGASCCGATGEFAGQDTGYTCEEVGAEVQCVATPLDCVDYSEDGGGKFLMDGTVSMCRVEVSGEAATDEPGTVSDSMDVGGSVSAFNYWTETYVESTSISSFTASFAGSDFTATGTADALVDGSPTQIEFEASEVGGAVTCTVSDGSGFLAGGEGETGRADLELTITPVP